MPRAARGPRPPSGGRVPLRHAVRAIRTRGRPGARASRPHRARSWRPTPSSPTRTAWAPTWSSLGRRSPTDRGPAWRGCPSSRPASAPTSAVRGEPRPPYLRFRLPGEGEAVPAPGDARRGESRLRPRRLVAGAPHRADGPRRSPAPRRRRAARAALDRVLAEPWWRDRVERGPRAGRADPGRVGRGVPPLPREHEPGDDRPLHAGRAARPPEPASSRGSTSRAAPTHPGQWVSFCAISGVLAAEQLLEDLA